MSRKYNKGDIIKADYETDGNIWYLLITDIPKGGRHYQYICLNNGQQDLAVARIVDTSPYYKLYA